MSESTPNYGVDVRVDVAVGPEGAGCSSSVSVSSDGRTLTLDQARAVARRLLLAVDIAERVEQEVGG